MLALSLRHLLQSVHLPTPISNISSLSISDPMEPASPSSYSHEYFIGQPDFANYESPVPYDAVPPVEAELPRFGLGSLNSLQLTGSGMPSYFPPSYVQSIRSPRPVSPLQSISPPLTSMSASDLSETQGLAYGARSTGTSSPASSSHGRSERRSVRNSAVVAAAGGGRRNTKRRSTNDDEFASDEDDVPMPVETASRSAASKRREEVRRQRIESEQRRRDELRDGYRRLKDVLPVSNQKSSKVSLLDRATTHIRTLEMAHSHMIMKINELETEIARLRNVNETLMLSAAERRSSGPVF